MNIFVVEGGDRLTIQSVAPTEETAENNARKALEIAKSTSLDDDPVYGLSALFNCLLLSFSPAVRTKIS